MALIAQNLAAVLNKTVDIDIQEMNNPRVSCVVSLFLLSLVFLVITHGPLVHALAWVILNADHSVFKEGAGEVLNAYLEKRSAVVPLGFAQPVESLEQALDGGSSSSTSSSPTHREVADGNEPSTSGADSRQAQRLSVTEGKIYWTFLQNENLNIDFWHFDSSFPVVQAQSTAAGGQSTTIEIESVNITDEEKEQLKFSYGDSSTNSSSLKSDVSDRPFLDTVLSALDCSENDYLALLSLCLIYALANNKGK